MNYDAVGRPPTASSEASSGLAQSRERAGQTRAVCPHSYMKDTGPRLVNEMASYLTCEGFAMRCKTEGLRESCAGDGETRN